jgi:hypothetical protein
MTRRGYRLLHIVDAQRLFRCIREARAAPMRTSCSPTLTSWLVDRIELLSSLAMVMKIMVGGPPTPKIPLSSPDTTPVITHPTIRPGV